MYKREKPCRTNEFWKRDKKNRIMLKSSSSSGLRLNRVGTEIFERCDGKNSVEEIVKFLSGKYVNIPRERIQIDVDTFLEGLENMGFIIINWETF